MIGPYPMAVDSNPGFSTDTMLAKTASREDSYPQVIFSLVETLQAKAASREDSHPQVILKLRPLNSFNYRVSYGPQP